MQVDLAAAVLHVQPAGALQAVWEQGAEGYGKEQQGVFKQGADQNAYFVLILVNCIILNISTKQTLLF